MAKQNSAPKLPAEADAIVVGGGFYGCCLALFLRSVFDNVILLESSDTLLSRASFSNQARIHTGFHYPRSFVTAGRSLSLYKRFMRDFRPAVIDDFTMLYAIARNGSRITPERFRKMYADMKAPIETANDSEVSLFDNEQISAVFRCAEFGFDASILKQVLVYRLKAAGVKVIMRSEVASFDISQKQIGVPLTDGRFTKSRTVFDATYGQLAAVGGDSAPSVQFKYELAEIALIEPPDELDDLAITVMDGPFFSTMPFRARNCHSLTHVRYTPHKAWLSGTKASSWPDLTKPRQSRWLHMKKDAQRFLPCMQDLRWRESLFEVKTVLMRNEADDGRPIILSRNSSQSGLMCVLGGKLDNIYDLYDALKSVGGVFSEATTEHLVSDVNSAA